MKEYNVIIIGSGASGCICAIEAAKKGKNILLIDKQSTAGKKLMVTGNGRCNITNTTIFPSINFYNQNIDKYFSVFSSNDAISYFKNMGLICYADDEGRVYPISNSAKSAVDIINNTLSKYSNITLSLNNTFENVEYRNKCYYVKTSSGEFSSKQLVIATGGNTAQQITSKFNITTKPFTESLVALKTNTTKNLEGIRLSPVNIRIKTSPVYDKGEILFKDSGISGIVAFNISSYFSRKNDFNGELIIDLLPNYSEEELIALIKDRKKLNLSINKMFDGIFVPAVAYEILNKCKIDENRNTTQLKTEEIKQLVKMIKSFTFKVKSHYNNNQIFSGGVLLTELTENLESKKQKDLFFCGEVCDVDGICGGYNLQWAWTSGYIVGVSL